MLMKEVAKFDILWIKILFIWGYQKDNSFHKYIKQISEVRNECMTMYINEEKTNDMANQLSSST